MLISVRSNLIMRSLSKNDAKEVYRVIDKNRTYLRPWLPWVDGTNSPTVIENVITTWESELENKKDIVLGIFEHGRYIGNIGLHNLKNNNHSGMIGYWLAENSQGNGVITDCVKALMNFGFYTFLLNRIYIHCAAGNMKSRAIPERLGFIKEGILKDGECLYGTYHDMVVYGLVKRNWQKNDVVSLVFPTLEQKDAALDYRQEYINHHETSIHGSAGFIHTEDYEVWLTKITNMLKEPLTDWVNCSTYFAYVHDKIIGTIQIRHVLNDSLMLTGGHIGYGVRPIERQKGYATKMLALALERCRELGIEKVLITCNKGNTPSMKTILKFGGVFENEVTEEDGTVVQRYWVEVNGHAV